MSKNLLDNPYNIYFGGAFCYCNNRPKTAKYATSKKTIGDQMLHVQKNKKNNIVIVSCVLKNASHEQMRCLTPSVGIGWILGALGQSIALSNRPGHQLEDNDVLFQSIRLYISVFTEKDFNALVKCSSLTDRTTFMSKHLPSPAISSYTISIPKQITAGWLAFNKMGDNPTDVALVQDFIKDYDRELARHASIYPQPLG